MPARFQLIRVDNCGHRVAVIRDTRSDDVYKIRRKGTRFLLWDRNDDPVTNPTLRRVAREALA